MIAVSVEKDDLVQRLARVGERATARLKEASLASAVRIRDEARQRVARRTGATARGIAVEESHDKTCYVVVARDMWTVNGEDVKTMKHIPLWLERGTTGITGRPAKPFFDVSAQLEVDAHLRRVSQALDHTIRAEGLGD